MYIILNRAKKNLGDFLILNRFLKLLKYFRPDVETELLDGLDDLEKQSDIDHLNSAQAIIFYGGPGYRNDMYPAVYPLVKNLDKIKTRFFTGGMGSSFYPVNEENIRSFKFNRQTQALLERINSTTPVLGARDIITLRILRRNGIDKSILTGCPVWYDLESIGKKFEAPAALNKIVFTPPARLHFFPQAKSLLGALKKNFASAEIIVSFQRGLTEDEFSTPDEIKANRDFAEFAGGLKCETVDTSYDEKKIEFYNNCDMHVGYRVHGHIWFLSKRKPTILVAEDSRGVGILQTIKTPGIKAFNST